MHKGKELYLCIHRDVTVQEKYLGITFNSFWKIAAQSLAVLKMINKMLKTLQTT